MKSIWDYIENFSRSEFACECGCGFDTVDIELLTILIDLRNRFGVIKISGPNRCVHHNETVQKKHTVGYYVPYSSKSYHTKGMAVDAKFPESRVLDVYKYLKSTYPNKFGFILYHNRIHIDVRPTKYRHTVFGNPMRV